MIVTLVSFAFFFGILISRIGLPPMVGFLAAGFAYNFAGLEAPEGLQTIADLGVTLLLFSIGLKLKLKDLAAAEVWGTSVTHVVASTIFFACMIFVGQLCFDIPLFQLSFLSILTLAFGLSFSSTVYAVKVLEDKGDISALYGKVAIGILVMQDIFAVIYLTVSEGKYPSVWAILVFVLLIPQVRKAFYKLIDYAGHGELLVVSGLFFALGAGYEFFYSVDLKGDPETGIIGYKAKRHADVIDVENINHYEIHDFWDPIRNRGHSNLILDTDDFYILASKEEVSVPPDYAAEMRPYDTYVGEFRVHYAGFFDPGFGHDDAGGGGSRAVLEVRAPLPDPQASVLRRLPMPLAASDPKSVVGRLPVGSRRLDNFPISPGHHPHASIPLSAKSKFSSPPPPRATPVLLLLAQN